MDREASAACEWTEWLIFCNRKQLCAIFCSLIACAVAPCSTRGGRSVKFTSIIVKTALTKTRVETRLGWGMVRVRFLGDGSRSKARSIKKKKVYKTGQKKGTLDRQQMTEGMRVQGMKRQSISSEQSKLTGIMTLYWATCTVSTSAYP